ncbi:MAG: saccharopine dehydrogenase C-terminal domain-containing protein [Acidimicrobiia bacterium]
MATLVLGAGIVGSAAVWDLRRRGHDVSVADADEDALHLLSTAYGATPIVLDAANTKELTELFAIHDVVVSAIPYRYGYAAASAALATNTHYLDFGGNPSVVAAQKRMDNDAASHGLMIVPDCGLAPGLANVLGEDLVRGASDGPIDSLQLRVGALPQHPAGALNYQLAFNAAGLVNEYAEPCEVIVDGRYTTVEPLSDLEQLAWPNWGPLEAFSTAGGTSTMCVRHEGRVHDLQYKTLRYPGHGAVFRAMYEIGLFDESARRVGNVEIAPREVLLDALNRSLQRDGQDIVLIRVWMDQGGRRYVRQMEDTTHGAFTALARTTAFPATALADLITRGDVMRPGVLSMNEAVTGSELLPELDAVGLRVEADEYDV